MTREELIEAFKQAKSRFPKLDYEEKLYDREYQCAFYPDEGMAVYDQDNKEFERYNEDHYCVAVKPVDNVEDALNMLEYYQEHGEFEDEEFV